tara:strand:- start:628 stop:822 length:195 start_codon:yes stop_codon:yes gene_type:complete
MMQPFNQHSSAQESNTQAINPKVRSLGNGFVLLTVGPFQETVQFHEIQQVTQMLQDRFLKTQIC